MKKVIVVSALLVALVLMITPALAAPRHLPKVTWHGSGIAENGAHVKFSGVVSQTNLVRWEGDGTLTDRDSKLVADIRIDCISGDPVDGRISFAGLADVTVAGVSHQDCEVNLNLDRSKPEYDIVIIAPGGMSIIGRYVVTGDDFHGSIRMT